MGNRLDVLRLIIMLLFVVVYIVFLCLVGDTATTHFECVNTSLWSCSLNEFPIEIQKTLPMILAATQNPVYMEGFMNVRCTREVLKLVNWIQQIHVKLSE